MSGAHGTHVHKPRRTQRGSVLLGLAGGMLVAAGGLAGAYVTLAHKNVASAANRTDAPAAAAKAGGAKADAPRVAAADVPPALTALLAREVEVTTSAGTAKLRWADLGVEADPDELGRASATTDAELTALAGKGALPVRVDRDKAVKALLVLKGKTDRSPTDAYLDLEARTVHDDTPGQGIDVWASLPRLELAARQASPKLELVSVPVSAAVTKQSLGISDISQVLGHYKTNFSVADRDRNFNLKLAASHLDGVVLQPGVEFSFNAQVGERSEQMGYKIAHVINAGEMVDGLAGGTCQISTTLFGASFFAGLDVVKTTNHSRPSAYTPLGFDATVVWPNTDLKLKNPYDFPVVIHYRVANGESFVEILGKARPYDKIVFERHVLEETPYTTEDRPDDAMPATQTMLDQAGFDGYKLSRFRRFYKDGVEVKTDKWIVEYKPVTEYVRRGTNTDPDAKPVKEKEIHALHAPDSESFSLAQ